MIVGNGKVQAGMAIVNGGLCVDNDGWCTASTTGRISSQTSTVGNTDLAEIYTSDDELAPGDIVAVSDPVARVHRADASIDGEQSLGIISTAPGITLGLQPGESAGAHQYPVALAGRVPVKVSSENGPIRKGDFLTLSSIPGVAMKAVKAGTTIGQALESYSGEGISKITAFIKNSYTGGTLPALPGLAFSSHEAAAQALAVLLSSTSKSPTPHSTVIADQLFATEGVLAPSLFAEHLDVAASASFSGNVRIEKLSVGTIELPTLADLSSRVAVLEAASTSVSLALASADTKISDVAGRLDDLKKALRAGENLPSSLDLEKLTVKGPLLVQGALSVESLSAASGTLSLMSDMQFIGRPYFTSDNGGFAVIRRGDISVNVTFAREYIEQPAVNATLALDDAAASDAISAIFTSDVRFAITRRSVRGFSIVIDRPAPADVQFSWIAMAVRNARLFTSRPITGEQPAAPAAVSMPPAPLQIPMVASTSPEAGPGVGTSTPAAEATTTVPSASVQTATTSPAAVSDTPQPVETAPAPETTQPVTQPAAQPAPAPVPSDIPQ